MNDFTRAHKLTNRAKIIIHSANSAWKADNVANFRLVIEKQQNNKQKQNKTKTGEKKEERWKKQRCGVGLKLCTINAVERWSSRINGAIDSLKKNNSKNSVNEFRGNEWRKEHTFYALQSRYTKSAKYDGNRMLPYLDFRCYFEANGQNHIHFWLIQVLKNIMTWYFLTFWSLSSKLELVYPPWSCGVEEQMLIFSSIQSRS